MGKSQMRSAVCIPHLPQSPGRARPAGHHARRDPGGHPNAARRSLLLPWAQMAEPVLRSAGLKGRHATRMRRVRANRTIRHRLRTTERVWLRVRFKTVLLKHVLCKSPSF
jgi:hypothetical protein